MGKTISELTGKLKTLSYQIKKTDEIITKGDKEALERYQASIANITEAVSTQKESIKEKKFNKGESKENMTRNLGHARAANVATLSKSESRNASRLRDFTEKTDL